MKGSHAVRVGIIGRGFGEAVVAPAFRATEGCEVVDVVSPRDEAAVSVLCGSKDVDLISVHSPPFLHLDHVRLAIAGGHAVLCDKPFGRNAAEAAEMCELAASAGVLSLLNFEFRYDAERVRLRERVQSGAVGKPEYFSSTILTATSRVPLRPYGWLFDGERGGGWIGALGSHLIDFARWTFGEIDDVSATVRTGVPERPDAEGRMHRCTAEDGFTASLRSATGVSILIDSTSAAPVHLAPSMVVIGSEGALELTADHRIVTRRSDGDDELQLDVTGENPMLLAMKRFAAEIPEAVQRGTPPPDAPTFADGLACAEVMDRMRACDPARAG
jgi:predicted dehydrogenase